MNVSKRAKEIAPSATLAISSKAKELKSQGLNIISFGAGEPDFDTPTHIKDAACLALEEGFTKYTATEGILSLKEAIREKFKTRNNLDYSLEEIIVSCGAKHSLFNAFMCLLDPGDEVILPLPYWVSYDEQIRLCGAKVVPAIPNDQLKIDGDTIRRLKTPNTKLIVLTSPNNPTGVVYTKEELMDIGKAILETDIGIISDEIYEDFTYGIEAESIVAAIPELKSRTITVNGVSKTYSMTGWRIGYAAGPKNIIKAMANLQAHSTSNPTSFAQKAAVAALRGPQEDVIKMRQAFLARRDVIVDGLNNITGISCSKPLGAFYVFPDVSQLYGKKTPKGTVLADSQSLSQALLEEALVAVVPGKAFGTDRYVRLSYATDMKSIKTGLDRIAAFVECLS
ncbi:MAG: pyridoxal phosphate-dependent aminotransferase [Firmicutes bacterium]|nr:pyridoxal phosphate-dependent aminotransferase [Bacillota bacterium]MDD4693451.1 pyridoxal phosphate-dependent aminotransferase [Bacillota bacterium]